MPDTIAIDGIDFMRLCERRRYPVDSSISRCTLPVGHPHHHYDMYNGYAWYEPSQIGPVCMHDHVCARTICRPEDA